MPEVDYEPRGLSDHSPVAFSIKIGSSYGGGDWKMNSFSLKVIEDDGVIAVSLEEFINLNSGTAPLGIMWDSLKAFLRGGINTKNLLC